MTAAVRPRSRRAHGGRARLAARDLGPRRRPPRRAGGCSRARRAHRRRRLRHVLVHGAVVRLAPRDRRSRRDRRVRGIRGLRRPRLRRGRRTHPLGHDDRGAPARRRPARLACARSASSATRPRRSSTSSTTRSRCRSPTSSRSCRPDSPRPRSRSSAPRSAKTSSAAIADAERAIAEDLDPALVDAEQYTFLGRGWSVGLAHEAALKMREASQSWTESYPVHGVPPRPDLDRRARPGHLAVRRGARRASPATSRATGARFEAGTLDPMAELVRAQRVALARARAKGLDPDAAAQPHPLRHPRRADDRRAPTPTRRGPRRRAMPVLAFDVGGTDTKSALIDADGTRARPSAHADAARPGRPGRRGRRRRSPRSRASTSPRSPGVVPVAAGVSVPGLVDERAGVGIFASNLGWRDAPDPRTRRRPRWACRWRSGTTCAPPATPSTVSARRAGTATSSCSRSARASRVRSCSTAARTRAAASPASSATRSPTRSASPARAVRSDASRPSPPRARSHVATTAAPASRCAGAREVLAAATAGDPLAARVWDDAVEALARGTSPVSWRSSPPRPSSSAAASRRPGAALFEPLGARLDALLSFHRRPALVHAELGDDAGLLGTALAARDLAPPHDAAEGTP